MCSLFGENKKKQYLSLLIERETRNRGSNWAFLRKDSKAVEKSFLVEATHHQPVSRMESMADSEENKSLS
jgi:hypothetical protein